MSPVNGAPDRVVIIGGGIVGACAALFLRAGADRAGGDGAGVNGALANGAGADEPGDAPPEVIVLERDPSYAQASTTLSAASIRSQFSGALNVRMSEFGWEFLRPRAAEVGLVESAYLILATPGGEAALRDGHAVQTGAGAEVALLDPPALKLRFPWLNVDDLAAGTLGLAREGWFDAHALLRRVRAEAIGAGARFVHDAAVGMDLRGGRISAVRTAAGHVIEAGHVVNAAGPGAAAVAAMAGVPLPVEARKRTVFVLQAPLRAPDMPMVMDASGFWLRPEGDGYIGGITPPQDPPADGDFSPDMALFEDVLWPLLAHRIPAFEQIRVRRAWAGHYEMCTLDHNAIIGPHPEVTNLILANGFSGHGVQHGPATGRGVAELIRRGGYQALDLSELGYARVREGRPILELNIY